MTLRSTMTAMLVAGALGLSLAGKAMAQEAEHPHHTPMTLKEVPGRAAPSASIADLAWLAGFWTGNGLGGVSEEMWSPPAGGAMMGTFRLVKNGAPVFYEFVTIVEAQGTLVLKLKHFKPDMTGWEEKDRFVSFPLLKVTPTEVYFDGLTYARDGDNRLKAFLAIGDKEGHVREEMFVLERATP